MSKIEYKLDYSNSYIEGQTDYLISKYNGVNLIDSKTYRLSDDIDIETFIKELNNDTRTIQ